MSDVYISVTAMTADSAVTAAVKTDSAVTAVAADSDVFISVTALSVATTFTVMCTSLSH